MGENNIRFTASAYEDLDRITDYLIERDLEAAIRIYERIMEAVAAGVSAYGCYHG